MTREPVSCPDWALQLLCSSLPSLPPPGELAELAVRLELLESAAAVLRALPLSELEPLAHPPLEER